MVPALPMDRDHGGRRFHLRPNPTSSIPSRSRDGRPTPRCRAPERAIAQVASAAMDRQATFLLALGMLIAAAAVVSVAGWILFVRDRRAGRASPDEPATEAELSPS